MPAVIGITAGEIYNSVEQWSPVTYGQSRTYTDAIIEAEGVPLILPLTNNTKALRAMYDRVGGILLAGGNDISPGLYGEEPLETTIDVSIARDEYEKQLIIWALEDKKPILAICRGMQLLNAICGGSLYQHIPTDLPQAEDHTISSVAKDVQHLAHSLSIEPASKLAGILKSARVMTNSHHHQAINRLAPSLQPVAWTSDGVIEGLESKNGSYIIGVQSHPESLVGMSGRTWLKLFASLVQASVT